MWVFLGTLCAAVSGRLGLERDSVARNTMTWYSSSHSSTLVTRKLLVGHGSSTGRPAATTGVAHYQSACDSGNGNPREFSRLKLSGANR
jgi:hypothetical protein